MTITRLVAKNFKSLKNCEIELSPLTVLVGENSSGKSSVLQVLGFLAELENLEEGWGNLVPLNAGTFKLGTFDQLVSTSSMTLDGPKRMELGRARSHGDRDLSLVLELEPSDTPGQAIICGVKSERTSLIALPRDIALSIADDIRSARLDSSEGLPDDSLLENDFSDGGALSSGTFIRQYRSFENEESLAVLFTEALEAGEVYVEASDLDKVSDRRRGRFFTLSASGPEDEYFVESYSVEQFNYLRHSLRRFDRRSQRFNRSDAGEVLLQEGRIIDEAHTIAIGYEELMALTLQAFDEAGGAGLWALDFGDVLKAAPLIFKTGESISQFVIDVKHRLESRDGPPIVSRNRTFRKISFRTARRTGDRNSGQTRYLSGLRTKPSPISEMNFGSALAPLGSQGQYESAIREANKRKQVRCPIIDEMGRSNFKYMALNDAVGYWLSRFGIAKEVRSELQGNIGYRTELVDIQTNEARDPTFYGIGASQLLPVLTLCLLAEPGDTILIEQPELHVHPGPQQILGDFLLGITESDVQVVVETHSEYLVNRLRRRMVEDPTSQLEERVSILYASRVDGSTTFERLIPTPDGSFAHWPDGFFDQGANEAEQIMRAVISKRRANQPNA